MSQPKKMQIKMVSRIIEIAEQLGYRILREKGDGLQMNLVFLQQPHVDVVDFSILEWFDGFAIMYNPRLEDMDQAMELWPLLEYICENIKCLGEEFLQPMTWWDEE